MGFPQAAKCIGCTDQTEYNNEHQMGTISERFTERSGIFQRTEVHNVFCVDQGKWVCVCDDGAVMCVRHANRPKSSTTGPVFYWLIWRLATAWFIYSLIRLICVDIFVQRHERHWHNYWLQFKRYNDIWCAKFYMDTRGFQWQYGWSGRDNVWRERNTVWRW